MAVPVNPEGRPATQGDELQRGVRNMLAMIRSLARRSSVDVSDVDDYVARFDGRLGAFARVQAAALYEPTATIDLCTLVIEELLAHAMHEGDALVVSIQPLRLGMRQAGALALAVHELAADAFDQGAWSPAGGHVRITGRTTDGSLLFEWQESVASPPGSPRTFGAFGREYLEDGLRYDLNAATELKIGAADLRFRLRMPLH